METNAVPDGRSSIDTSWSQLISHPIGRLALTYHTTSGHRLYHNWTHVRRLYWHAKHTFGFPYDPNLDLAIMWHDSVYDDLPMKEIRSAKLFSEVYRIVYSSVGPVHGVDPVDVERMILDTIDHLDDFDDPRMILLDLADLMNPEQTTINYSLLQQEAHFLYKLTGTEFASGSIMFMTELRARIEQNRAATPADVAESWTAILAGIDQTIKLSNDKLNSTTPDW
jgi:predicted metal-dependent HD superfamily phosphohydrolase